MNTKTALQELSTRFDTFEERFDRMGADVSTIAALFYNYVPYVDVYGWKPVNMSGWRVDEVEELVLNNIAAWKRVPSEEDVEIGEMQ